jgi:hypothetical protein
MIAVTSPMIPVGAERGSRSAMSTVAVGGGGAFSRAARHDAPRLLRRFIYSPIRFRITTLFSVVLLS